MHFTLLKGRLMDIHMEQHHSDGEGWCLHFISKDFEFTEEDLTAVRRTIEPSIGRGRQLGPLDQYDRPGGGRDGSYRGEWTREDGKHRTNRLTVSCTKAIRPGPTVSAYKVLRQRYPSARFTMYDMYLREQLTARGLDITTP